MGLFHGRFASTGAGTFVDGAYTSASVTVGLSTCIIWEGHQDVLSVIAETKDTVSFNLLHFSLVFYISRK